MCSKNPEVRLPPVFYKVRNVLLGVTTLLSLVFATLLSVEVFVLGDRSDSAQRNLVGLLIGVDAFTGVLIPALLLVEFRPWLDAVRLGLLLVLHIGSALPFTLWNSAFYCPNSASERKTCKNVNIAILACSWIIPALLVWHVSFFAVMYRQRDRARERSLESPSHGRKDSHMSFMDRGDASRSHSRHPSETLDNLPIASRFSQATTASHTPSRSISRPHIPPPLPPQALRPPPLPQYLLSNATPYSGPQTVRTAMQSRVPNYPPISSPMRMGPSVQLPSKHSSQTSSVRFSQQASTPSVYTPSQVSSHDSRRYTVQPPRRTSNMLNPILVPPQSSRVPVRIDTSVPPLSAAEAADNSSPGSSGRLAKSRYSDVRVVY